MNSFYPLTLTSLTLIIYNKLVNEDIVSEETKEYHVQLKKT